MEAFLAVFVTLLVLWNIVEASYVDSLAKRIKKLEAKSDDPNA